MKILVFGVGAIGSLIVELVKTAGFKKIKYRKISPLTFT